MIFGSFLLIVIKPFLHKGVSIWNSCSKKYLIIFMLKLIGERKIVWLLKLTLHLKINFIFVDLFRKILHVFSTRSPVISCLSASYIWFHSPLIKRVFLFEPENIQLDCLFIGIFDWKVVPLSVTFGVGIHSHVEIVFVFSNPILLQSVLDKQG